ncbi:MAG: hypothetical protein Q7S98_03610, partial [Deltaproteobacteria bacterium]|nr:hypothetical protein [Deltaproteobacteria bacterium]
WRGADKCAMADVSTIARSDLVHALASASGLEASDPRLQGVLLDLQSVVGAKEGKTLSFHPQREFTLTLDGRRTNLDLPQLFQVVVQNRFADEELRTRVVAALFQQASLAPISIDLGGLTLFGEDLLGHLTPAVQMFSAAMTHTDLRNLTGNLVDGTAPSGTLWQLRTEDRGARLQLTATTTPEGKPFVTVQVEDRNGPLAHFTLYPTPEGATLRVSEAVRYERSPLFQSLFAEAERVATRTEEARQFNKMAHEQQLGFLGTAYFQEVYSRTGLLIPAFIATANYLNDIAQRQGRKVGKSYLQKVLANFGYPVLYILTGYKLYVHYLEQGINIPARFGELLTQSRGRFDAFIKLINELKAKDPAFSLRAGNLQELLIGFGYPVHYIGTVYKLYVHYQARGIDIPTRFGELLAESRGNLDAFIQLMNELKAKDPAFPLNKGNVEGLLVGFGYPVSYINTAYKLHAHYLERGVDIPARFGELLAESRGPLDAFIKLMNELKAKDQSFSLNEGNLERVLAGFGYPVRYISTQQKLYVHYLERGVDISAEFDRLVGLGLADHQAVAQIAQTISDRRLPFPAGNFSLPLFFYVREILIGSGQMLGRLPWGERSFAPTLPDTADLYTSLAQLAERGVLDGTELAVLARLLAEATAEEIQRELGISEQRLGETKERLGTVLTEHEAISYRSSPPPKVAPSSGRDDGEMLPEGLEGSLLPEIRSERREQRAAERLSRPAERPVLVP